VGTVRIVRGHRGKSQPAEGPRGSCFTMRFASTERRNFLTGRPPGAVSYATRRCLARYLRVPCGMPYCSSGLAVGQEIVAGHEVGRLRSVDS
jgi:hypothetical protein